MKWLSLIGKGLLEGVKIWTGFSPIVKSQLSDRGNAVVDKITDTLNGLGEIVVTAEAMGAVISADGPKKLEMSVPLAIQLVLKSDLMTGKEIHDPALFAEGAKALVDGTAKILNSIKDK